MSNLSRYNGFVVGEKPFQRTEPVKEAKRRFEQRTGLYAINARKLSGSMRDYVRFRIKYPTRQVHEDSYIIRNQAITYVQDLDFMSDRNPKFQGLCEVDVRWSDLGIGS
jgi:hypothetical protein